MSLLRFHGGSANVRLDFSTNLNPMGTPDFVVNIVRNCTYGRYPDYNYTALRSTIAKAYGLNADEVVPVNGASEGLYASIAASSLMGIKRCATLSPNYGDSELAALCTLLGMRVDRCLMFDGLKCPVDKGSLIILSNPNNPTGTLLNRDSVVELASKAGLAIVDEAYINLSDDPTQTVIGIDEEGIVVVRSLTKELALPGLRLGFIWSRNARFMNIVKSMLPSWNVNSCAEAVGVAIHGEYWGQYTRFLEESRKVIRPLREFLARGLSELGFKVMESRANFILSEAPIKASELYERLLRRGIAVRVPVGFFGLSERHIRISVKPLPDEEELLRAIREVFEGG